METVDLKTVGSFVAEDYRTASVFQKYGIDFCCGGGQPIDEVCEKKGLNLDKIISELNDASTGAKDASTDFNSWELDKLVAYIKTKHHTYVTEQIPVLLQFLNKLCNVHGGRHPELLEIDEEFRACATELSSHLQKEELILFPFIEKMVIAKKENLAFVRPPFGTIENPINMMRHEHDVEGDRFKKMLELSNNFTPPADGCTTYRVAFQMLKDFEDDLHTHIHLENNILFPKAILLEKTV